MKLYILLVLGLILIAIIIGSLIIIRKRHLRRLRHNYYLKRWKAIQKQCKDNSSWPQALQNADQLLDRALRKKGFKGKTMGERMVSAQRTITDNDALWFAHNLSKKIRNDGSIRLKEKNIKSALVGFRQALRDIGALPANKNDHESSGEKKK